tara:strand:+ start:171 stop:389 length:219 start_codon:yes stop_codon:yes gene_type:complete
MVRQLIYGLSSIPNWPTSNENNQKKATVTKALASSVGQKPIRENNVGNSKHPGSKNPELLYAPYKGAESQPS